MEINKFKTISKFQEDLPLREAAAQLWQTWKEPESADNNLEAYCPLAFAGTVIECLNDPKLVYHKNVVDAGHHEVLAAAKHAFASWEQLDAAVTEALDLAYRGADSGVPFRALTSEERTRLIAILDMYQQAKQWVKPGGEWEEFIRYHKQNSSVLWDVSSVDYHV